MRGARTGSGLLEELLAAPDRDHCPGALPVVSFDEEDEAGFLASLEEVAVDEVELSRRGRWHGRWAELDPMDFAGDFAGDRYRRLATEAELDERWHEARPLVLPGVVADDLDEHGPRLGSALADHAALREPGGLRRWLNRDPELPGAPFRVLTRASTLDDPERDLERVLLASDPPTSSGRTVHDLWLKTGWLSTHEDEDSLRLRFAFGKEGKDDASRDLLRHRLISELATRLLPETQLVTHDPVLAPLIERRVGEPVLFTHAIAYWNAPDGGALFHHDAFDEDPIGGQLGVCFLQLVGRTAWLALSIADLAARVREFVAAVEAGELPWVRAQLDPVGPGGWSRLATLSHDRLATVRELALPGQGVFGPLVNRGPEFTAFLADAGHATLLGPGDAIVLPNHGFLRTTMHSVFCASDDLTYGLSLAIRSRRPPKDGNGDRRPRRRYR